MHIQRGGRAIDDLVAVGRVAEEPDLLLFGLAAGSADARIGPESRAHDEPGARAVARAGVHRGRGAEPCSRARAAVEAQGAVPRAGGRVRVLVLHRRTRPGVARATDGAAWARGDPLAS